MIVSSHRSVCDRKVFASPASHHEKAHKSASLELPAQLVGNSSRESPVPQGLFAVYITLPVVSPVCKQSLIFWSLVSFLELCESLVFLSFKIFPLPARRECFSSKEVACNIFFSKKEKDLPYNVMVRSIPQCLLLSEDLS